MITAIIVDDTGSTATVMDKMIMLGDVSTVAETFVVSTDPRPEAFSGGHWICDGSIIGALRKAAIRVATKRVLVFSSALTFESTDLARFIADVENSPLVEHLYLAPATDVGVAEIPPMNPDAIVTSLARYDTWPMMCVATTRSMFNGLESSDVSTVTEILTSAMIRAISDGDSVRRSTVSTPLTSQVLLRSLCQLEPDARARCLSIAVDSINIEELFPHHAWADFSQESAAAVYHSLAALFIRFGDTEAAAQCLEYSERLEESPRYFALRGMIQHQNGETLGAVANMVSSLQCYESRKVPDGKHYISFKPKNLEIVTSRLVDGLNALNKRENDKALTHFSEAIFNFDPFYSEYGVQSLEIGRK